MNIFYRRRQDKNRVNTFYRIKLVLENKVSDEELQKINTIIAHSIADAMRDGIDCGLHKLKELFVS